jgi:hypothetical protein
MSSLRFNPDPKWNNMWGNRFYAGLTQLMYDVSLTLKDKPGLKMLEIGSYKGESTFMFAALGIFEEIHCIDPHEGNEEFNLVSNETWGNVQEEFKTNTRHFNNITHYKEYSYDISHTFHDGYFDFIYIDGAHDYISVKKDIELYLPKTKHLIGGHDYQKQWPGVIKAVNERFNEPDVVYPDDSWVNSLY